MNTKITLLKDLQIGQRIMEDVYAEEILILKRGTIVNDVVKNKLKRWGIKSVEVSVDDEEKPVIYNYSKLFTVANHQKNRNFHIKYRQKKAKRDLFFNSLKSIYTEARYGKALHDQETIKWLEDLFVTILSEKNTIYIELLSLKEYDEYTYNHSFDVFILASLIANSLNLNDIKSFAIGCLLHDIGKMNIPKQILTKKEKLTDLEFELVKRHTILGYQWLQKQNLANDEYDGLNGSLIGNLALSHHKRLNGSGYPNGIKGEKLSNYEKILMVVDMFSAITLKKVYQEEKSTNDALKILLYSAAANSIEKKYVIQLIKVLSIYPTDSIVKLSNNEICKIKRVPPSTPYLPTVINISTLEILHLPPDLSITIKAFLKYEPNSIFDDIVLNNTLLDWDGST